MNISIRENLHMGRNHLKNHCQLGLSLSEMMVAILFVGMMNLQEIGTSYSSNQANMIRFDYLRWIDKIRESNIKTQSRIISVVFKGNNKFQETLLLLVVILQAAYTTCWKSFVCPNGYFYKVSNVRVFKMLSKNTIQQKRKKEGKVVLSRWPKWITALANITYRFFSC